MARLCFLYTLILFQITPAYGNTRSSITTEVVDATVLSIRLSHAIDNIRIKTGFLSTEPLYVESLLIDTPAIVAGIIRPGGIVETMFLQTPTWDTLSSPKLHREGTGRGTVTQFPFGLITTVVPRIAHVYGFIEGQWKGVGVDFELRLRQMHLLGVDVMYSVYEDETRPENWFIERPEERIAGGTDSIHLVWRYACTPDWGGLTVALISSAMPYQTPGILGVVGVAFDLPLLKAQSLVACATASYRTPKQKPIRNLVLWKTKVTYHLWDMVEIGAEHSTAIHHLPLYVTSYRETRETISAHLNGKAYFWESTARWETRIETDQNGLYTYRHTGSAGAELRFPWITAGVIFRVVLPAGSSWVESALCRIDLPVEISLDRVDVTFRTSYQIDKMELTESVKFAVKGGGGFSWYVGIEPKRALSMQFSKIKEGIAEPGSYFQVRVGCIYRS